MKADQLLSLFRNSVPIRNELVVQLMRSAGTRKINGAKSNEESPIHSRRASKNNVRFRPGMNAAAVRTGKLLCFQFDCLPAFFFDCFTGIGQLGRRRTAHEQALKIRASLRFGPSRRIE